jgi:RNA polymerase sigma-70 factor (ECF subfamily)
MDSALPEEDHVIDANLLRQTAAGDVDAFGLLYDRTSCVLLAIAGRILRDDAAAEDLLQEVYVQVWEKAATFNAAMGRPVTWLITLTRNRAIDRLRSSQRRARVLQAVQEEAAAELFPGTGGAAVAEPDGGMERNQILREALSQLPAEQRIAIELAFFGGLSQSEIAERLASPLGTIKARIRRGMIQLRTALGPLLGDEGTERTAPKNTERPRTS